MDSQGRIVRERAARVVATMIVEFEDSMKSKSSAGRWIAEHVEGDPRLYLGEDRWLRFSKRRLAKPRVDSFASYLENKSAGNDSAASWRRDVSGWINGKHSISPDKLRRLAVAMKVSWIEALLAVGYYQHIIVLISELREAGREREAAIVASFAFRSWTDVGGLVILDLFMPGGEFQRALPEIENGLRMWDVVPARVKVEQIRNDALRCAFRLCDPSDYKLLGEDGVLRYPCSDARLACENLLKPLFSCKHKAFDAISVHRMLLDWRQDRSENQKTA